MQHVPDLESFLTVSADSTMCSYDIIKGAYRDTYRFHSRPLHCFTWLPGGVPSFSLCVTHKPPPPPLSLTVTLFALPHARSVFSLHCGLIP